MNLKQAEQHAAKASRTQGARYVVWVYDQGREIYDSEQARRYASFLQIESVWIDGAMVTNEQAAAQTTA